MKLYQRAWFAAVVMVVCIAGGTLLSASRSLRACAAQVEGVFYEDAIGIAADLDERLVQSGNLLTVAQRYISAQDPSLLALRQARDTLSRAQGIGEKYRANEDLGFAAEQLASALSRCELSQSDARYARSIPAELQSRNDIISHNNYNELAHAFNEKLRAFPASLLSRLVGVRPAEYFR